MMALRYLYHFGNYWIFMKAMMEKPEKLEVYRRQILKEMVSIGYGSIGIVAIISIFIGAVITIQTSYNLLNPLVPVSAVALVTRDSIIIEFSPTIISLVLAGKVGSSIASELGTMRVSEQIDALEIMGINAAGYLVLPKIIASIIILPFIVTFSMALGIGGGMAGGIASGVINFQEFIVGLNTRFVPYNVVFALTKSVVFGYLITSVSSYHGFYARGGALEVGQASTYAVVYSSVTILIGDYVLTQLFLT
jgi:phospholipid/cholesterol/gamma-HCH transport system permease protein